jgi:hypothetical protein
MDMPREADTGAAMPGMETDQPTTGEPPMGADGHAGHGADMPVEGMAMPGGGEGRTAMGHGSGTSLVPANMPMYGEMAQWGRWHASWHGVAHLVYDDMNGTRGGSKLVSTNMFMGLAKHDNSSRDHVTVTAMVSLEPLTVGGSGYPLLLQTGESWNGVPLVDHQHPHNYFSELSFRYDRDVAPDTSAYIYLAPVGEPALGPTAYVHRILFLDHPIAPIGHHWQDATHIAYGVITLGGRWHDLQLEASVFNGREPSEQRYRIDSPELDSASGRISYAASDSLALQASYGFLKSPEELHPEEDIHRTTASAHFDTPVGSSSVLEAVAVWGRNRTGIGDLDSYLLEATLKGDCWTPFARFEQVEKNAEELLIPSPVPPDSVFTVRQLTLGVTRELGYVGDWQVAVGAAGLLSFTPSSLDPFYGSDPTGFVVFLRIHPPRMQHM